MRLKQFLKNSIRPGLNFLIAITLASGCISSTKPTYLIKDIEKSIQNICKEEYKIDVITKLAGQTLWIYLPLEDLFEKSDKPEKYFEKFAIEDNKTEFQNSLLKTKYSIKPVPDKESYQEYKYNKEAAEKVSNVWKVLRRVIFSTEQNGAGGPNFFCLITADTKKGIFIREIFYCLDLKKVSYGFISWGEYHHRSIQESAISPLIIENKEGKNINYQDLTMNEFIALQINQRIKLKFQKPEVEKNADIDKEIIKIIAYTMNIYGFGGFERAELENSLTKNKFILDKETLVRSLR